MEGGRVGWREAGWEWPLERAHGANMALHAATGRSVLAQQRTRAHAVSPLACPPICPPAHAKQRDHEEVHDEHRGPRVQAGEQRHRARCRWGRADEGQPCW